jgi:hypothetical protein
MESWLWQFWQGIWLLFAAVEGIFLKMTLSTNDAEYTEQKCSG